MLVREAPGRRRGKSLSEVLAEVFGRLRAIPISPGSSTDRRRRANANRLSRLAGSNPHTTSADERRRAPPSQPPPVLSAPTPILGLRSPEAAMLPPVIFARLLLRIVRSGTLEFILAVRKLKLEPSPPRSTAPRGHDARKSAPRPIPPSRIRRRPRPALLSASHFANIRFILSDAENRSHFSMRRGLAACGKSKPRAMQ